MTLPTDLQRTFENISDNAQIIYTTHSLFLINKNHPRRNKVISKTKDGTKIDQKPFQKNWKSVRESLGILLSNNFLIADKTLLTEGPSDVIYILDAIKRLKASGDLDLDLNDLSVVDAGSSDNYIAMAKLMLSEGRSVVALLDGDKSGDDTKKKLEKICEQELQNKQLTTMKLPSNKSTEDLFADLSTLQESIENVAQYLVDNKIRKFEKGIKVSEVIKTIQPVAGKTLGKTIDEMTASIFEEKEKLSKLSIALDYEDLAQQKKLPVKKAAADVLEQLRTNLGIRGEKTPESGVFDEVS